MSDSQHRPIFRQDNIEPHADFDYEAVDRGNPLEAVLNEDDIRSAFRIANDWHRMPDMVIDSYDGDKAFALDCKWLALGWYDLAKAHTQEELAKRHKCTRANVNRMIKKFQAACRIPPLIGQRDEAAREKFKTARIQQLKKQ